MSSADTARPFIPLNIAVLTISDTRSLADDKSGATLVERIEKSGHAVAARAIVTDDVDAIRVALLDLHARWKAGMLDGKPLSAEWRKRLSRGDRVEELADVLRSVA